MLLVLLTTISLTMVTQSSASSTPYSSSGDFIVQPVTSKTLLGDNGTVYMLWTVHSALSGIQPGIWYAEYRPNGTAEISPTLLRNSTDIQSADMVEDKSGNLHLVWSEGPAFTNSTANLLTTDSDAQLYYAKVNSTNTQLTSPTPLTGYGKIVVWPSIAVDNESIPHIVWMEESINTHNRTLSEYYGTIKDEHVVQPLLLSEYGNQSFVNIPRPQMIYDQDYSSFHIAWTYSQEDQNAHANSQVRYASIDTAGNETRRIAVADLKESVQDTSIAQGGNGSAYVIWQVTGSDSSSFVYVSRISNEGRVVFQHSFSTDPSASSSYLVAASDSQENLYLVWYPPPQLPRRELTARSMTNVSYMKIDEAGSVTDSGNGMVTGTVLAIGVSNTGDVYAVSSLGIIKVKTTILTPLIQVALGITALSAMGLAITEEGKYRFIRSVTSLSHVAPELTPNSKAILQLLTQKPGSSLREIEDTARTSSTSVSMSELTRLERAGYVSSVRVGFSRRFFDSNLTDQSPNRIASMILNEIKRNPRTWEGKIARDLGLSQQIVHYHVKRMRSEGLLDVELEGRRKLYRLANSRLPVKT